MKVKSFGSRHVRLSQLGMVSPRTSTETAQRLLTAVRDCDVINGMSPPYIVIACCGLTDAEAKSFVDYSYAYLCDKGFVL